MKKLLLFFILVLTLSVVTAADMNSEIDYYFNMEYPNTTNSVTSSTIGTWFFGANYPNGIIGSSAEYHPTDVTQRTRYELVNFAISTNPFSFSIWLNTNTTGQGYFWAKASVDYQYFYSYTSGTIGVDIYRFSPSQRCKFTVPANLNDNNWHNIILVKKDELCNQSSWNIWIDDVLATSYTYTNTNPTNMTFFDSKSGKWNIGSTGSTTFRGGYVDEVGIFLNYEVTQSDADVIWANGVGAGYPWILCEPSWYCSQYSDCISKPYNHKDCLAVSDYNSCGDTFTGDLATYEQTCTVQSKNNNIIIQTQAVAKQATTVRNPIEQLILNFRSWLLGLLGVKP